MAAAANNAAVVHFATFAVFGHLLLQASGYVPERVFVTAGSHLSDFESLIADVATADVVFVGEQHDDPNTHRLEAALLEGLLRRDVAPTVSLEMFERDVQPLIDAYLAGTKSESEMLEGGRPWPRYKTDYRLLVELAKANGWPVVASNVPRRLASAVAKGGRGAIDDLPPAGRQLMAADLECPLDGYFDRFAESMASHPAPNQTPEQLREMSERYYWSQCVKDETMAEAIAAAVERREKPGPVVHYNGAFHSDFGLGTAERVRRRLPGKRIVIISVLPVENLDALSPAGEDLERADYLVYTTK
jgi:uncharacterized iron-regulated protein